MRPLHETRLFAALASTRLSIVLGFTVAALLALSSLMVPDPRGKDPLPFSESVLPFFDPIAAEYWWFYLLLVAVLAWGVNGLFGTWRTWVVHAHRRDLRFAGVFLMHLAFLVALLAHLVAGFTAGAEQRAVLSSVPTVVAGRTLRVAEVRSAENPDGSLRSLVATIDLGDGEVRSLGYNQPLFFDGFTRFLLLQEPRRLHAGPALVVVLRRNDGLPLVFGAMVLFFLGVLLFTFDAVARPQGSTSSRQC